MISTHNWILSGAAQVARRALRSLVTIGIAAAVAAAPSIARATTIEWLGPYTSATGVSGDGSVVAYSFDGVSANVWRRDQGTEALLGVPPQPPYNVRTQATSGVSQDGTAIAGTTGWFQSVVGPPNYATIWRGSTTGEFPPLGAAFDYGPANALSANGSIAVGQAILSYSPFNSSAARWDLDSQQAQLLGTFFGGQHSSAMGVSGDGSIVVGWGNQDYVVEGNRIEYASRPFAWTETYGFNGLDDDNLGGTANAVSADGSIVVGSIGSMAALWHTDASFPSLWSSQTLGLLPGGTYSIATSTSSDGSVVVGYGDSTAGQRAFLWTSQLGMIDLHALLAADGVDLSEMQLTNANAISADGRTIVGRGTLGMGPGSGQGWIVTVPEPTTLASLLIGAVLLGGRCLLRRTRRRG